MSVPPVPVSAPGLVVTEHEWQVPLDHAAPDGRQITVFAREVADPDGLDRPYLLFLQGGPGMEAPRPTRRPTSPGWLERALAGHRVLLLDQRGTGRSTPVGDLAGSTPAEQADYLACFRADSVVRDAEWIRRSLDVARWSVLGQSFGGFCTLTYLSLAPESLRAAYVTGGLPPLGLAARDYYPATFRRVLDRVRQYYRRYPDDRGRVTRLVDHLEEHDVRLPGGDRLTARMLRQVGILLGSSDGAERLHYLLELPVGSRAFTHDVERSLPAFARNPLYAVLHEACLADGTATGWAAAAAMPEEYATDPTLLTGEHVFPWVFEDHAALVPLREAADLLARREWPRLYDPERLREAAVPAAAAVYADDMYVESRFSLETAALLPSMRVWLTNEYEHNGLRADGDRILGRLVDLAHGRL